jgi:hypothetical protein
METKRPEDDGESQPFVKEEIHVPRQRSEPLFGFVYMGIVGLLCFNFFLLVMGYLNARIHKDFGTWATMMYSLANNVGQLVSIFCGSRYSYFTRVWVSSVGFALIMVGYPLLAIWQYRITLYIGVTLTMALGLFTAVFLSAGFGLASSISPAAVNYYCFGQSLAGLIGWPLIFMLEILLRYIGVNSEPSVINGTSRVDSWTTTIALCICAIFSLGIIPYFGLVMQRHPAVRSAAGQATVGPPVPRRGVAHIIWSTLPLGMTAWIIMFVTFLVFPSTLSKWHASYEGYPGGTFFYFSLMVYVFQVADVIGRYIAILGVKMSGSQVMVLAPWRLVLVIFFYGSVFNFSFLSLDLVRFALVTMLGVTNGYLLSRAMMLGPSQVREEEADVAGYTMSFLLVNGLLFGSLSALVISRVISVVPSGGEQTTRRVHIIPGST